MRQEGRESSCPNIHVLTALALTLTATLPPPLQAIPLLKESIKKAYGKKGEKVVAQNCAAVDAALDRLVKVDIPPGWGREVRRRNCFFGSFNC